MPPQTHKWCSLTVSKWRRHQPNCEGSWEIQESSGNVCVYYLLEQVINVSPHWPCSCHQTVVKETMTRHVCYRGARTSSPLSHGPSTLGRSVCMRQVFHFPGTPGLWESRLSELVISLFLVSCSSLQDLRVFCCSLTSPHHTIVSADTKLQVTVEVNSARGHLAHNCAKNCSHKIKKYSYWYFIIKLESPGLDF